MTSVEEMHLAQLRERLDVPISVFLDGDNVANRGRVLVFRVETCGQQHFIICFGERMTFESALKFVDSSIGYYQKNPDFVDPITLDVMKAYYKHLRGERLSARDCHLLKPFQSKK